MLMCSAKEHVTEDWTLEIVFEMGEPMRRAHNCRPLADYGIGKAYAVWRDAVLNVLLHTVPMEICSLSSHCCDGEAISSNFAATVECPLWGQKRTLASRMSKITTGFPGLQK